jgi:hypothetical protein
LNDLDDKRGNDLLDLDAGRMLSLPVELDRGPDNERLAWLQEHGADLFLDRVNNQWGLLTTASNELLLTSVPASAWANRTPNKSSAEEDTVAQTLRRNGLVVYILNTNAQPPLTFSFQTGTGGKGMLQVTAFGENPNYARIRFFSFKRAP